MSRVAGGAQEGERQGVLSRFLHPEAGAESGRDPREAVLETLASALLRRSRPDAPLLIVWEDLHWADPSSIAFIITLLPPIQAAPTLPLPTARHESKGTTKPEELQERKE